MAWFVWVVGGVTAVGGAVLVWSLFGDRARGRRRCMRCRYAFEGVSGMTCPECGLEHRAEHQLLRPHRHWWIALVSLCLCLVGAHGLISHGPLRREGLLGLVPTSVLALIGDPDGAWVAPRKRGAAGAGFGIEAVLFERVNSGDASLLSRRIWSARLAASAPTHLQVAQNDLVVRTYHAEKLSEAIDQRYGRYAPAIWDAVQSCVWSGEWRDIGGASADAMWLGDRVIVAAPSAVHSDLAKGLDELSRNAWSAGLAPSGVFVSSEQPAGRCFARYNINKLVGQEATEDEIWKFSIEIQRAVSPDAWVSLGGAHAKMTSIGRTLVVFATPEVHSGVSEELVRRTNPRDPE